MYSFRPNPSLIRGLRGALASSPILLHIPRSIDFGHSVSASAGVALLPKTLRAMATDYQGLYTDLGYLYYSVAAADGHVRPEEREELMRLIKERWLPLENSRDELGTDAAHYIDIGFDYATENNFPKDEAFERFGDRVRRDPAAFDEGLRRMIFQTAVAIASAFASRNKAELNKLMSLKELFQHNPAPPVYGN
jgi:hypothetical protein